MSHEKKVDFAENTEFDDEDSKVGWRPSTDSEGGEDDGFLGILVHALADMVKNNQLPLGADDLSAMRALAIAEEKVDE